MDLTWIMAASAAIAAVGGVIGFWNNLTSRITSNKVTAEIAKTDATAANFRIDALMKELADQRETNARHIGQLESSNDGLINAVAASERRLAEALESFGERFTHLSDRLDRLMDRLTVPYPESHAG